MRHPVWVCLGLALFAAGLSGLWIQVYLRGGPRIIDATSYLLQAKGIAAGQFAWQTPGDLASHAGRFLISPEGTPTLGVIFPPGYPALLAVGVLAGVPMAVGPLLAAALAVATYQLARALFQDTKVALLAAALSVVCAALRYHTADTMSHGASALAVTLAIAAAVSGRRGFWIAGLACGFALATRPVTGVVVTGIVALCALRGTTRLADLRAAAVSALPGVALFLLHQRATTGHWLSSSQRRYYALSDAPVDCFRYGFGDGIGCRFEHGDFVAAHLQNGYGVLEALGTTGRRLLWHALDVGNIEPLAYLGLLTMLWLWRDHRVRLLSLAIVGVMIGYAPFYFDGSYPGGGARMFADVLPLEHVLIAYGATRLRVGRGILPMALFGFALRASFGHGALAAREGGRPMFEPALLSATGIEKGLLFVQTDHGYNLGFDPRVLGPDAGVVVARQRRDHADTLTWNALGKPNAYVYRFDPSGALPPRVESWTAAAEAPHLVEGESLWPVWGVHAGSAHPGPGGPCASQERGLRLQPGPSGAAQIVLRVPLGDAIGVRALWAPVGTAPVRARLSAVGAARPDTDVISNICGKSSVVSLAGDASHVLLEAEAWGGPIVLDAIELVLSPKSVDN